MRYWDTSAILPLIVDEPARARLLELYQQDSQIVAWWTTPVEIASAVARREREGRISADEADAALKAAKRLVAAWHEVVPSDAIRRTAERLLRVHSLRAADSLQLSAALIAANHDPSTLEMLCLDSRLAAAARREGFVVVDS
ncbi:MAG: type II toxin-antitoxin system VapC family toxin [Steroidobacteraceae bacterium]